MRVAALFRDMPIRRKLTLIAVLSAGAALVVAALVSMVSQWYLVREELVRTTTSQTTIVAANSTSALIFNDPKAADQTLAALRVQGDIEFAVLHDRQGERFALYLAVGQSPPPRHQPPRDEQHVFTATHLDVFLPIVFEGERVGSIHVRSSLNPVYQQIAWSAVLAVIAALGGLGVALALVGYLHPAITDPMIRLVGLMAEVSRDKDYGVRAKFHGKDELGALAQGLNDMLAQIQLRDNALAQHRQHLEDEVVQRTTALTEANQRLEQELIERKRAEERSRRLNEELDEKVRERTQQLVAAQEDLVRKEKLAVLGQVAGSVGHELRNPLGVMSNAVYFLQTVLSEADATTKEYLGIIQEEIVGAERIVADLLDSVRTKPPQTETVGVKELIGRALRKCNVPAGVGVTLEIPDTLPPLRVDPLQIHQVLRNLIVNGIDAMPGGGTLEIRVREDAPVGTIAIGVRDTGCGMTPEQLARLFQPLFTTKARGIGLGLVVVKNLTAANGGTVVVESEAGKGTLFTITLPAADERENEHA